MEETFLQSLLESQEESKIQRGLSIKESLEALVQKYSKYKDDIYLKTSIPLESRCSNVYAFYVFEDWIYLLDDDGADMDPYDVEEDFLNTFTNYIAEDKNVKCKL